MRKRLKQNKGLPLRVFKCGRSYFYKVPVGQERFWDNQQTFKLGSSLAEMYRTLAKRHPDYAGPVRTFGDLIDKYEREVVQDKAPRTQRVDRAACRTLKAVFGDFPKDALEPHHMYAFIDRSPGKVFARRTVAVASAILSKGVQWGELKFNPLYGAIRVKAPKPKKRRRVQPWEIEEALSLKIGPREYDLLMIKAYMQLKPLIALRQTDMLLLETSAATPEGILVETNKTGFFVLFEWTKESKKAWDYALSVRPVHICRYLFCNMYGECVFNAERGTAYYFSRAWKKYMKRALAETKLEEPFTDKDLRAYAASELGTVEEASRLLTHSDTKVTRRHYRLDPEKVKPLR